MQTGRKVILLTMLLFAVSVAAAGLYTLHSIRVEAYHQAGLDLERRLQTFWELAVAKGAFLDRYNHLLLALLGPVAFLSAVSVILYLAFR